MYQMKRGKVLNPKPGHSYAFLPRDASAGTKRRFLARMADGGAKEAECDADGQLFEFTPAKAAAVEKRRRESAAAKAIAVEVAGNKEVAAREADELARMVKRGLADEGLADKKEPV